jgi:hypothetical protein
LKLKVASWPVATEPVSSTRAVPQVALFCGLSEPSLWFVPLVQVVPPLRARSYPVI